MITPLPLTISAQDGFPLRAHIWSQHDNSVSPVVIINLTTSVHSRYYHRFATFLYQNGLQVVCYDYRGIGNFRPPRLRHFSANWLDWGSQDFEGILQFSRNHFSGSICVVGHSVSGFLIGMAPSNKIFIVFLQWVLSLPTGGLMLLPNALECYYVGTLQCLL